MAEPAPSAQKERALRALRRLVFVDRLLTLEEAQRCADLVGLPREAIKPEG